MENGMKIKGNEMEIKSLESHLKHILRAILQRILNIHKNNTTYRGHGLNAIKLGNKLMRSFALKIILKLLHLCHTLTQEIASSL